MPVKRGQLRPESSMTLLDLDEEHRSPRTAAALNFYVSQTIKHYQIEHDNVMSGSGTQQ